MIIAFSTSSPLASVAVMSEGTLLESWQGEGSRNASAKCLEQLIRWDVNLNAVTGFIADVGPGSFTGVRVGVMLAKTLGWANECPVAGISSFDLISIREVVSLPGRRGEWLVREPGGPVSVASEFRGLGYGTGTERRDYPNADAAVNLIPLMKWIPAIELLPEYHLAPSISTPKTPYRAEAPP
ncbi:MAG: tRNA (adenosine(37)-N6)-threonylcarbamoyltransferase complex dimerization subunit type 1 TsaB [Fimbriimonadaceae bacterium]|nr:tRNA (adenosine(37)-N6)-threonylcarbamoyltransferase complex dimerization subunit type 1 TsaB [Fimbriimonadaceae bacterium]